MGLSGLQLSYTYNFSLISYHLPQTMLRSKHNKTHCLILAFRVILRHFILHHILWEKELMLSIPCRLPSWKQDSWMPPSMLLVSSRSPLLVWAMLLMFSQQSLWRAEGCSGVERALLDNCAAKCGDWNKFSQDLCILTQYSEHPKDSVF